MKEKYMNEAPIIIKQFLGYLQTIKGKSPKTVEEYYLDLRTFFRYLKQHREPSLADKPLADISIADIDLTFVKSVTLTEAYEFMNYLMAVRHNGPAARSRKCCSLRAFYNYLTHKAHLLKDNPIQELESPKVKRSLPRYLTLNQSIDLLKQVKGPFKERDYCILILFLNCGMRLSELVGININDIRRGSNTLRILGKGNKERIIYLNEACLHAIDNYLKVRPKDHLKDKYALFISKQRKRISPKTVQYLVKKYLSGIQLGGSGYSVHKLRHTAATLMYQQGKVDIRVLQEILGHENLGTTEIYTHLSNQQMEKAAESNPLSHITEKQIESEQAEQAETEGAAEIEQPKQQDDTTATQTQPAPSVIHIQHQK
ncbi:tyrosine recombinase XerC [Caproicibacterium lactatifermentans]|jgi:site-specific recombinase XerD|uniref:Tyrosine-type recombinase/integrase n=1 Tax=Caproicibacterium lactatifermentans TaxID=2666138 RepID=A0A859DV94_9FIRM|nr:tyrosine recombinase XerC [Caproicibacterium lactatifermentans]QKN23961.1 tyrosine-type recombinase/integrase [Caproicibacterium lactatifermentans]